MSHRRTALHALGILALAIPLVTTTCDDTPAPPAVGECDRDLDCAGGRCVGHACVYSSGIDRNAREPERGANDPRPARAEPDVGDPATARHDHADGATGVRSATRSRPTDGGDAASCRDGVKNGSESDVDCGGGACVPCAPTRRCGAGDDCQSGVCAGELCVAPTCTDLVENGDETDVDCGGPCAPCLADRRCGRGSDCAGGHCVDGRCALPAVDMTAPRDLAAAPPATHPDLGTPPSVAPDVASTVAPIVAPSIAKDRAPAPPDLARDPSPADAQ